VKALHVSLGRKVPRQADCVFHLLRSIFRKGQKWDYFPDGMRLPTKSTDWGCKVERDRFVSHTELKRLFAVLQDRPLMERAMILSYILTGLRLMELIDLTWNDVDFENSRIVLSGAKNKSGITSHRALSDHAKSILESLPRNGKYVFSGRVQGSRQYSIDDRWRQIRVIAGLPDVRIHDLRRTCGSYLAQQGKSLHLIAAVLGQTSSYATKIYARYAQGNLVDALNSHGEEVYSLLVDRENPIGNNIESRRAYKKRPAKPGGRRVSKGPRGRPTKAALIARQAAQMSPEVMQA